MTDVRVRGAAREHYIVTDRHKTSRGYFTEDTFYRCACIDLPKLLHPTRWFCFNTDTEKCEVRKIFIYIEC